MDEALNPSHSMIENRIIEVKTSDLAGLSMLMDWIIDNYNVMYKSMINIDESEILPLVHKWDYITQNNF